MEKVVLRIHQSYPVVHESTVTLHEGETLSFGRSEKNNVVLNNRYVSREHFSVGWTDGRLTIKDGGSLNGTRLNGKYIRRPMSLRVGDRIDLSRVKIFVEAGGSEAMMLPPKAVERPASGDGTVTANFELTSGGDEERTVAGIDKRAPRNTLRDGVLPISVRAEASELATPLVRRLLLALVCGVLILLLL